MPDVNEGANSVDYLKKVFTQTEGDEFEVIEHDYCHKCKKLFEGEEADCTTTLQWVIIIITYLIVFQLTSLSVINNYSHDTPKVKVKVKPHNTVLATTPHKFHQ